MPENPDFDVQTAHKYFSAHCFNSAWDLIEKSDRTADDDDRMIRLAQASVWHWTQREDCAKRNLSVTPGDTGKSVLDIARRKSRFISDILMKL